MVSKHFIVLSGVVIILSTFFIVIKIISTVITHEPSDSQKVVSHCSTTVNKTMCYIKELTTFQQSHTFNETYSLLHKIQKTDPALRVCHTIAHQMAYVEVSKNSEEWINFLKQIDINDCSYGFLHGAIESYIKLHHNVPLTTDTITTICNIVGENLHNTNNLVWDTKQMCSHTMGHIILLQNEGDVIQSLSLCSNLTKTLNQTECATGVFMEYINGENLKLHGYKDEFSGNNNDFQKAEILCNSINNTFSSSCWGQLAIQYNELHSKGNPFNLYSYCKKAKTQEGQQTCFLNGSIYTGLYIMTGKYPSHLLQSLCEPVKESDSYYRTCIQYVTYYVSNGSSYSYEKIIPFCTGVSKNYQKQCYTNINDIFQKKLSKENHLKLCKNFPNQYKAQCTRL